MPLKYKKNLGFTFELLSLKTARFFPTSSLVPAWMGGVFFIREDLLPVGLSNSHSLFDSVAKLSVRVLDGSRKRSTASQTIKVSI